ncbi:unnamed protein product [Blepharisma stoltei]|uniref:Uncharacterized protein n=1 Tax=Blepharisma stoltei TaxID=1481888 RepID=A0AAU9IKD3_9CILI|nr:unnamed protein product [Blepharisma stoltei]
MKKGQQKPTRGFVDVQDDRFWTWRVDREESHLVQLLSQEEDTKSNIDRLQKAVIKAKKVAAKIKSRPNGESP